MKIWLGTWNCGQGFPTRHDISALVGHGYPLGTCDLVVLGLQECSRNHGIVNLESYQLISHQTAMGQTYNTGNCQALFIWEKASEVPNGQTWVGRTHTSVVPRDWKKTIKFWAEYGKGSANTMISWRPAGTLNWQTFVISSAHLDSKSPEKRTRQLQDIMNSADTLCHGRQRHWDVQFLMGDLNFRVNQRSGKEYTLGTFADTLIKKRWDLFAADSLSKNPILSRESGTWNFPPPYEGDSTANTLCWPTYKKIYEDKKGGAEAKRCVTTGITRDNVHKVWDIKRDDMGYLLPGKRPGEYDFGWLDRVGWRKHPSSQLKVTHVYSGAPLHFFLSDHAPMYTIFDVN